MSLLEELKTLGVNVDEAMDRLMGNTSLYEKMLGKFADMIKKADIDPDFDSNDYAEIIEKTHSIKDASGNLSLTPIYEAYTKIVNLLRSGQPEQAKEVLKDVLPVQTEIINCIERNL